MMDGSEDIDLPAGALEPVDELVAALLTASRVLVGIAAHSLADLEDTVTHAQYRTLVVLSAHDTNLQRLADGLGVQPSTAMRMVDRLLIAGLVTRTQDPTSRREVLLSLSPAGSELVSRVAQRRVTALARTVYRMPEDRRGELVSALTEFAAAAGEEPAPSRLGW